MFEIKEKKSKPKKGLDSLGLTLDKLSKIVQIIDRVDETATLDKLLKLTDSLDNLEKAKIFDKFNSILNSTTTADATTTTAFDR